jgi:hypothetical protein
MFDSINRTRGSNTMTSPLFQHRHYRWLANYCRQAGMPAADIEALSYALTSTNPNFDRQRFVRAASAEPDGRDRVRE